MAHHVVRLEHQAVAAVVDLGLQHLEAHVTELTVSGLTYTREETDGPWLFITNMQQAVRFVPFIIRAYDDRSA